jgi:hypothetical protein
VAFLVAFFAAFFLTAILDLQFSYQTIWYCFVLL